MKKGIIWCVFFLKTCYGCGVKIDYSGTNVEADTVGAIRIKQVRNGDFGLMLDL